MTERSFPFDIGVGKVYNAAEWRKMMRRHHGSGVRKGMLNGLAVTAGSGLEVLVASGQADVLGEFYENDASKPLVIEPADGANPRLDLVVLELDVRGPTDQPNPAILAKVVVGTPLAAPVIPSMTQTSAIHQIPLASVAVAAAASSVGAIVDYRPWSGYQPRIINGSAGGSATTSSTSYVDMTTMDSGQFYSDGGDIEVTFSGSANINTVGGNLDIAVALDGGAEAYLGTVRAAGVSYEMQFSARHLFESVNAGFHRIKMRFKVGNGAHVGTVSNSRRMLFAEVR